MSGRAAGGPLDIGAAIRLTLGMATGMDGDGATSAPEGGTPGAMPDPLRKSDQMVVALIDRLQEELAEARAALWKYGQHHPLCEVDADTMTPCGCGYVKALTGKTGA